jgi:hypothetical protein
VRAPTEVYVVEWADGSTASALTADELAMSVIDDETRENVHMARRWYWGGDTWLVDG